MKKALEKNLKLCNNYVQAYLPILLATFFLPIVFLMYFPSLFFNVLSWIDPFIYVGYGLNYPDQDFLSSYYKISRLPHILLQYFFRTTFNPSIAGYLLHFTIYATSAFFIFKLVEKISNKLAAFLIAISTPLLFVAYSGGADYHNNFSGLILILLLLYVTTQSLAKKDSSQFFFNTGLLYALVVHTNLLMSLDAVVYSSCLYLAIKILNNENAFAGIIKKASLVIIGFIASTLILCIINYSFGRQFLFMMPLWSFAISGGEKESYWLHLNDFIWQAKHLSCFVTLFIFSLFITIKIAVTKNIKKNSLVFFANLAFTITFCTTFASQLAGANDLHVQYFAFTLLVPFLITLGANLNSTKTNLAQSPLLFIAIAAIFFIALFKSESLYYNYLQNFTSSIFISYIIFWAVPIAIAIRFRNNFKTAQILIFSALYFVIVITNCAIFYNEKYVSCDKHKSSTDFYVEFNNHLKKYRKNSFEQLPNNIFAWMNTNQTIRFKKECNFYSNKLDELGISTFTTSSGNVKTLDNIWRKGGMNNIDNLWKENDGKEFYGKKEFLEIKPHSRVLVLLTYDENDAKKMIAKMKGYGLNFSIAEKRAVYLDSFMAQYFILIEDGLLEANYHSRPTIN